MNCTDDGRLQDSVWDNRHHVTPSHFNIKNSSYYKVIKMNCVAGE